jgi:protein-S-isoprenylcysteine O-methyltransferase Ste14
MSLAQRNLFQNKARLSLSAVGVALSVMLILILNGFLTGVHRQALLTLIMFPILVTMYIRLGRREEREVREEFGEEYARYAATTPAFFPRLDLVKPNRA